MTDVGRSADTGASSASRETGPGGLEAPEALVSRIEAAIEAVGGGSGGRSLATVSPETFLLAAERLFERKLRSGCVERASALELLVVDALVTYAFERASDDPERIEERAHRAMLALAAFGTGVAAPATG